MARAARKAAIGPRLGELPDLAVRVDGTPVPQPRARVVRGARGGVGRYESAAAAEWKGLVAISTRLALMSWRQAAAARWPTDTEYSVEIEVRRARAVGDLDNFAKAVLDACNGIVWADDRQLRELRVVRRDHDDLAEGERPGVSFTVRAGR